MEVAPGLSVWTDFGSGTDNGIIVGKNQRSSGQDIFPSVTNSASCEMTNAWSFFDNYGCFTTPAGFTNIYDDTSCASISCIGVTELKSLNIAWNAASVPMGSATGCNSGVCSPEELAGDFIFTYNIAGDGQPWDIHFHNVVPNGDPSGFGNVRFEMFIRGIATLAAAPMPTFTPTPDICYSSPPTYTQKYETYEGVAFTWGGGVKVLNTICSITKYPSNGKAIRTSVPEDSYCGGVYTPNAKFIGIDSFSFSFTTHWQASPSCPWGNQIQNVVAEINVLPLPSFTPSPTPSLTPSPTPTPTVVPTTNDCTDLFPSIDMLLDGKGHETAAVESTLSVTFSGHIVKVEDAGKKIKICPGTELEYSATATVGEAKCAIHHKAANPTGTLTHKDKLTCTNKPVGDDTDRFKVKRAKKKDYLPGSTGEDPVKKSKGWHH